MKYANILLATAAVSALAGAVVPTAASAKTSPSSTATSQADEIRALRAQIEALTARLDAQQAAQEDVQASNAMVQAQIEAAQASAAAANETAAKAGKDFKPLEWAKDTKVSGRMYFNVSNITGDKNGVTQEKNSGFQIKRFYVGIDHKFDDVFSGNVTMDIDNLVRAKSSTDSAANGTVQGFYIKKAYLQAKLNPAVVARLGVSDMPWVPYAEGLYGYRHIEKTTSDLYSFGTSADWGVHVGGDLAGGLISYQVSAVDGAGYRQPQLTKTIDVEGRVSVQYKGFNAAIGGYTGKLGNHTQANDTALTYYRTATRFNALLAYKDKVANMPVTIGGEYFTAKNWKVKTTDLETKAEGYSVFASISPKDKWSVFGRYDWTDTNKYKVGADPKGEYFNVGVQYSPAKIVDLALVYKRYDANHNFKAGDFSYSNSPTALNTGSRDEIGLYGQFRF